MRVWVAIWVGSSHICAGIAGWLAGGWALRLLALGIAAGFVKGLPWTTNITLLAAASWLVTAVALGLRAAPDDVQETEGDTPVEPAETAPPTSAELAAAMHEIGAPHAHLSALGTHLDTTPEKVREGCSLAGIPIAGGVRMKGAGVSTGVKASHFPPRVAAPEAPVVGAVTSSNNSNNTDQKEPQEGRSIVPDPERGNRWLVIQPKEQRTS